MAEKITILPEDVLSGMNAIISVNVPEPQFSSQSKERLSGKAVEDAIYSALVKEFNKFINGLTDDQRKTLTKKIVDNAKVRTASEVARISKRKSVATKSPANLPSKLKDCSNIGDDLSELYICEGDSAAGTIIQARDANFQGIIPVRGKILNVMKMDLSNKKQRERFENNAEINDIIKALGAGVGEHFDIEKSRYGKVVFACFTEDTEVLMLDGTTKTFKELVEMEKENPDQDYWVYSTTLDGRLVPGKARHPRVTSYTDKIVHVVLDNGHEIKCTPDHLFLNREGEYVEAENLTPGTSLMPMYFKYNDNEHYNNGRQMYLDNVTGEWLFTHKTICDYFYEYKGTGWHRHHIDGNYLNNSPTNLTQIDAKTHKAMHAVESITKYNKSDAHRKRAGEIGKVTGPANLTAYNKSDEHKKVASRIGKIYGPKALINYNKSEEHRKSVANMNKDDSIKKLQAKGKAAGVVSFMIKNGYSLDEQGFKDLREKYYTNFTPSWGYLLSNFDSYEDMIEFSSNHKETNLTLKSEVNLNVDKRMRSLIAKLINKSLLENEEFNEENYNSVRTKRQDPRWDSILKHFGSYEEALEYAKTYNHMVKSVWIEEVETTPMFDFTVEEYHNFVAKAGENSGVVVHQCDADVDGLAINTLLLGVFYKLFLPMIKEGRVYQCVTPLFEISYKKGKETVLEYAMTELERIEIEERLTKENINYKISRNKGLGELNANTFYNVVLNPENRHLKRITIEDAEAADQMINLAIGEGSADDRKEWMIDHKEVIDMLGLYE